MLGEIMNISILGAVRDRCLYSGYPDRITENNHPVYIITDKELAGFVSCTVICMALSDAGGQPRLIVSPDHEVFYEPEIRTRLTKVSLEYDKLLCLYEKSCGALVYRRTSRGLKVLLVKNHNGRFWSFPKGHVEKDETEEQTALREIKEETGLNVEIESDFRVTGTYCPYGRVQKEVVFFLARAFESDVHVQTSEIDHYIWVTIEDAMKMCRYDNDTKLLACAENRLSDEPRSKMA